MLLLLLAVIGGVAAVAAGVITGGLDDPASSVPARELPPGSPTSADVAALRFVPALRGYRMDQVDAAMDRLGTELDRLHAEIADRDRRLAAYAPVPADTGPAEPVPPGPAPDRQPESPGSA